jgi:hypothetical protein
VSQAGFQAVRHGSRLSAKLSTAYLRALDISSSARRRVFCISACARRYCSPISALLACSSASWACQFGDVGRVGGLAGGRSPRGLRQVRPGRGVGLVVWHVFFWMSRGLRSSLGAGKPFSSRGIGNFVHPKPRFVAPAGPALDPAEAGRILRAMSHVPPPHPGRSRNKPPLPPAPAAARRASCWRPSSSRWSRRRA